MTKPSTPINPVTIACQLAEQLEARGQEYAVGGAIALGFWGVPRGTVDVDLTIFLSPDHPSECIALLEDLGCEFEASVVSRSLREHGFCGVNFGGLRLDVFLPIVPIYEAARSRRKCVELAGQTVRVWDAESLVIFKMMFFRRKDLADVEQILRTQGKRFDRTWVRDQLAVMYGARDPRLSTWDEIVHELQI